jgi:AP-4 complex subunit beta-1
MVLASSTKDLVEKKMIYFYLINFSKGNDNFARMAINTFLKDSSSQNPNIRALSLRHLSNLRFKGRDEYVVPLLKKGLTDFSALVKKSSIMGLTKLVT